MNDPKHIPGTGGHSADDWRRNDPHEQPSAAEADTYGEFTWDEYSQAWARTQEDRKHKGGWTLQWQG
jgi:hypothetical protein